MNIVWDGITHSEPLIDDHVRTRHRLLDAAKSGDWPLVLELVTERHELINVTRPDGEALYAPLHHAAYSGAPVDIVLRLIDLGAFRTLRNARGERPVDVAKRRNNGHLLRSLTPALQHRIDQDTLYRMQLYFHAVIRGRIDLALPDHALRLPELEPLLEFRSESIWFAVPGMVGGFSYWLDTSGAEIKLVTESFSRVVGGSGQRHEITSKGIALVDEGFV